MKLRLPTLAIWAAVVAPACTHGHAPRSGSGWQEKVFFDESCSNEENPAAHSLDVLALHDALTAAGKRAASCLGPEDRGTLLVVFGGPGCVRALVLEHPVPPRIEHCLVGAFSGTRIPPFRDGVARPVASWTVEPKAESR